MASKTAKKRTIANQLSNGFAQDRSGSYNRATPDESMSRRARSAKSVADSLSGRSATPRNNSNALSSSGVRAMAQMSVGDRDSFGTTWSKQTKKQKRTTNRQIRKATIKGYLGSK